MPYPVARLMSEPVTAWSLVARQLCETAVVSTPRKLEVNARCAGRRTTRADSLMLRLVGCRADEPASCVIDSLPRSIERVRQREPDGCKPVITGEIRSGAG